VLYPPPYGTNDSNGTNKENYRWFLGLRAKNGADEFANFIAFAKVMDPAVTNDALFDQQIFDYANVEEMLRMWAVEMNIDDWDSWGQSRGRTLPLSTRVSVDYSPIWMGLRADLRRRQLLHDSSNGTDPFSRAAARSTG
jgi:hypothetical protein